MDIFQVRTYKSRGCRLFSNNDGGRTQPASAAIRLADSVLSGSDTDRICPVRPLWQRLAGGQTLDIPSRHLHCLLCPSPALAPYIADIPSSIHLRRSSQVVCGYLQSPCVTHVCFGRESHLDEDFSSCRCVSSLTNERLIAYFV